MLVQYLFDETALWVPRVIGVIVIFVVFVILAKVIKKFITTASKQLKFDENLTSLLARTSSITLMIFGLITALGTLGINISALVAGLGLTGFALGFALKDTISNLLSGVLILLYRPFTVGNRRVTKALLFLSTYDTRSSIPRGIRYLFQIQNYSRIPLLFFNNEQKTASSKSFSYF